MLHSYICTPYSVQIIGYPLITGACISEESQWWVYLKWMKKCQSNFFSRVHGDKVTFLIFQSGIRLQINMLIKIPSLNMDVYIVDTE
jgi:hypothetical protein